MDYSKTVNLPDTPFSMKAGLTNLEPLYLQKWDKAEIYQRQQENRKDADVFILHDGPPYANGEIHIGHGINKIYKDIILKYKFLRGFKTPYIPGWDCHGLPIELKAMEQLGQDVKEMQPLKIIGKCRDYAMKYVKIQMEGFKRLGVFADWENPYLTLSSQYEGSIVEAFGRLVEKGYIYRGLRPILWCPNCGTALADAEVEYHDHTSPAIFVLFPVKSHQVPGLDKPVSVMIWTTTPWTLPANTGLSFHPEEEYAAYLLHGEYIIMARKLADSVLSIHGHAAEKEVRLTRADLENLSVAHPWIDRESKIVFGEHVTMDTGTGVVHTAPGHGMEDYFAGLAYGLPMLSPVDDEGRFTDDVPEWKGMKVGEANNAIIEFLSAKGRLYHRSDLLHSYPHCWRCKKPVIFRSKPQWFFKVSDKELSKNTISFLDKIKWYPKWGEERFRNMLEGRPDWCLSRQRRWGVPIPAFYCKKCGDAVTNKEIIDKVKPIISAEGIEAWYKRDIADFIPEGLACPKCGHQEFEKEKDILDVWFDSGVSHFAVLDRRDNLHSPADVYLEGNDQYRGWFQSSMWMSMAIHGRPPYKAVITHGMALDEQGKPMHKSHGNTIAPKAVYEKFGADVFRLWFVTEDSTHEMRIGEVMIQKSVDSYRKIRNTFRYLMGNLKHFDQTEPLAYKEMMDIDKYALALLHGLTQRVEKFYDGYEFFRGFREIYNFCAIDMSNRYLDILKDRLYIYPADSVEGRSGRTALSYILKSLMTMLAPILPFTMEEVFQKFYAAEKETFNESVHLGAWIGAAAEWDNPAIVKKFDEIMNIRETALKALENLRTAGMIGNSVDAKITIKPANPEQKKLLEEYKDQLRYFFIVSRAEAADTVTLPTAEENGVAVYAEKAEGEKCDRCWNYSTHVGEDHDHPTLCERCAPIVKVSGFKAE
ncbi:MAG: isoleucine--tRNA ligase [Spirochaetes bacterium GWF1_51_8]|nr:MAG: isoleucine--tRNA ligase [Spirochaetes bacterium GWF1_51_8]